MMNLLTINRPKCLKCGICAEICPKGIISIDEEGFPFLSEENAKNCALCGHCESVCTPQALKHSLLPEMEMIRHEKLREINPENLTEYFKSRRSIRKFLSRPVDKSTLEKIFETVSYSPTGVNMQQNKWIMICDKAVIRRLSDTVIEWMKMMIASKSELALMLGFEGLVKMYENGNDVICREAPDIVIGYTDVAYAGGILDSVIATSHLELLLPSFGLGGCWAGYVMIALGYSQKARDLVGLNESHAVRSVLMIGYPKYHFSKVPYRKNADVKWI